MGNAPRLERRLGSIVYQLLKNYPEVENLTPAQKARMVQKIFDRAINSGVEFDNPSLFKTTALGVDLEWDVDGTSFTMTSGHIEITDNLTDSIVEDIVESINQYYLDGEPWAVSGYGDGEYLEFTDGVVATIANITGPTEIWHQYDWDTPLETQLTFDKALEAGDTVVIVNNNDPTDNFHSISASGLLTINNNGSTGYNSGVAYNFTVDLRVENGGTQSDIFTVTYYITMPS